MTTADGIAALKPPTTEITPSDTSSETSTLHKDDGSFRFVRYGILFIALCCLVVLSNNILVMNLAFICMTQDANDTIVLANGTVRQRFDYAPIEKSWILSSVALGTVIGALPVNWLYARYGARWPFFIAGLLSAATTAVIPAVAEASYEGLVAIRFLQGLAFAADYAAVGVVYVRWAPLKETSTFIGILMLYGPISFALTNPVVGAFCTSPMGWRGVFYFHGVLTVVVFTIWLISYKDNPRKHKLVKAREIARIEKDKTAEHLKKGVSVPYMKICTNPTVLVVWLNSFIEVNTAILLLTYCPTYFNRVLGYSVTETAWLASIGSMLHSPLKMVVAFMSDFLTCISDVRKMQIFNTIATFGAGIFCLSIGYAPTRDLAVAALTMTCVVMSANAGGFFKCAALVSRQHAHFVLSMMQLTKTAAHIVGPLLVAALTDSDNDSEGWRNVYAVNFVLLTIASIVFLPFCTDQPADFTKTSEETTIEEQDKKEIELRSAAVF